MPTRPWGAPPPGMPPHQGPPTGPWQQTGPTPPPPYQQPGAPYPPPMAGPPGRPPGMPQRPPGYPPAPPGANLPPWAQPYPGHQLRPRPKSNTGPIVAVVLVAVLIAAAGIIGIVALNKKKDNVADVGYDDPSTYTTSYSTTSTTDETTTTTTDETTTDEEPTETEPAGPEPVYALGDNPLFMDGLYAPAITCNLATWNTSPQGAADFFLSAMPCLDAAWQPVMEAAGLPFYSPSITFPEGTEWSSPCGSVSQGGGAVAAFYCGQDNTLYMPFAGLQTEMYGAHPGVYLAVLSHEYGHHVQAMSGVLSTYDEERYNAGVDTEAGLELSRRLELQAQCFSGMFFAASWSRGSVDDNILNEARTSQDRGDHTEGAPRDHGTDEHAISWWEQGAQQNYTWQCNTWLSPPEDVA